MKTPCGSERWWFRCISTKQRTTMTLDGKVAIVTGAGTGIGQGISRAFAKAGAKVVVDYVGKASIAQQTLDEIQNAGGTAMGFDADISNQDDVNALIAKTVESYGKVDIFVNNAGIEKKFDFVDYPLDEWQKIMAVNLTGPFLCSQAAARQMIKQGNGGRIINISSVHEDLPLLTNAPYCASKGGLRMLMRTIAVELAKHKITVNNIGPGAIYTPIDADVEADKTMNDAILAEIPLGRWGQPDEIGNMALYLASDDASYITGSTFFVDGGMLRNAGSL
jgi:glucose 1-dehydrogenase